MKTIEDGELSVDQLAREGGEDAVLRAVRQLAVSVFESEAQADAWLHAPNEVLAGQMPAIALATTEGHRAVVNELKRLEYARGL